VHLSIRPGGSRIARVLLVAAIAATAAVTGGALAAPSASAVTTTDQPVAPTITGTPPPATATVAYDFAFGTGSSNPPPVFTLDGTLPEGLALYRNGEIFGTPTGAQSGPVTVTADNGVGTPATTTFTLVVNPAPPYFDATPPDTVTLVAGSSYYGHYVARGFPVTPTLSASDAALPPGLSMNQYGELTGTVTTPGTYTFTVTATNGTSPDATVTKTIIVTGSAPSITASALPDATQGVPYDFSYTLGGSPAPAATVVEGTLPVGIDLGTDGHLTGTPFGAPGSYTFTVAADNIVGPRATQTSTITVQPSPFSLTGTPTVGSVGEPYDFWFGAAPGFATEVLLTSGALPPGVELNGWGELTGTPTRAGTYHFRVKAYDVYDNVAVDAVTVRVGPPPTMSISGGSVREGNSGTTPMTFTVSLSRASTAPVSVHWSTSNGTATAGSDYVAGSGGLTFAPGQTTRTITVLVKGDRAKERNETFTVHLAHPSPASLKQGVGTGTIVNDD
jgi:hypothetical protein